MKYRQQIVRFLKRRLQYTWLHPRYLTHSPLREAIQQFASRARGKLLDIGCGRKPYQLLFAPYITHHFGIDWPASMHGLQNVDVVGTTLELPIADNHIDTVLATEVMEHVLHPKQMLAKIYRVLRPGGIVILSVPLHEPLHELPYDYYRYTDSSLRHLLTQQRLYVCDIKRRSGTIAVCCYLLCAFLYRRYGSTGYPQQMRMRPVHGVFIVLMCTFINMLGTIFDQLFYDNFDTLGFVVLAKKPEKL